MGRYKDFFGHIKDLILRRFPSERQKKIFEEKFEEFLCYRTVGSQIFRVINFLAFYPLGLTSIASARDFLDE